MRIKNTFSFTHWWSEKVNEAHGWSSDFSFSCTIIDILLMLNQVNIDLSSLLLYLQMLDGQLTF